MRPAEADAPAGISVVTATVDRPDAMLRKARSLEAQTLDRSRFEWLIARDGTRTDLTAVLSVASDGGIAVRTVTTAGVGPGPARDEACRLARYPVLLLSDDDCLLDPETLARHLDAQRRPGVYLGTVVFEESEAEVPRPPPPRPGWWNLGGANASLPTASFRAVGGFGRTTEGYGGEDLWLGWRLHRAGVPFRRLPEARVVHLGPDPQRSGDLGKARQAGANAVRIARREPALAWRLGVHPLMLALKAVWLAPRGPGREPERRRYEREYARGARAAWGERPPDGASRRAGTREDDP